MIRPEPQKKDRAGTRVAVLFDYQGKRVRAAPAVGEPDAFPQLSLTPDDERSAIKQAIVRWLNEK